MLLGFKKLQELLSQFVGLHGARLRVNDTLGRFAFTAVKNPISTGPDCLATT
jgi:hypothetical protein